MKLTVMVGSFRVSLPYYLCKVVTSLKAKTLVIDNTDGNYLWNTLKHDKADNFIKRNNTIVLKNRKYSKEWFDKFDYVFVLYGQNSATYEKEILDSMDVLIGCTDYERPSTDAFKKVLNEIYEMNPDYLSTKNHKTIFTVWKDKSCSKIHEKDIESKCRLATTKRFILPLSESNSKAYESLTYNGVGKFSPLDKAYKACIMEIADNITDKTKTKAIKKMIK